MNTVALWDFQNIALFIWMVRQINLSEPELPKSAYNTQLWTSFLVSCVKIAGCGFLGLFEKIWLLVREIWKATAFPYIYGYVFSNTLIDTLCSQLKANPCNNTSAVAPCSSSLEKNRIQHAGMWCCEC